VTTPIHDRNALAELAREVAGGTASAVDLHAALLAATVFCERGPRPGFIAWGRPDSGLIAVFSSVAELALARGRVDYFSLTGADLLDLLPSGYDLVLDIAGENPLRLSMDAVGRVATLEVEGELQR
jgi:type III secretion system (T3SS) SseB-like protein